MDGIDAWDTYGCSVIYETNGVTCDNESINTKVHEVDNHDIYKTSVIDTLYSMLACGYYTDDVGDDYELKVQYLELNNLNHYTMEEINDAMDIFIYGGDNVSEDNRYESIKDVPFDLANACFSAINAARFSNESSLIEAWDEVVDNGVTKNE